MTCITITDLTLISTMVPWGKDLLDDEENLQRNKPSKQRDSGKGGWGVKDMTTHASILMYSNQPTVQKLLSRIKHFVRS